VVLLSVPFYLPKDFDLFWQGGPWVIVEVGMKECFGDGESFLGMIG
jgi:hypothetical protein